MADHRRLVDSLLLGDRVRHRRRHRLRPSKLALGFPRGLPPHPVVRQLRLPHPGESDVAHLSRARRPSSDDLERSRIEKRSSAGSKFVFSFEEDSEQQRGGKVS